MTTLPQTLLAVFVAAASDQEVINLDHQLIKIGWVQAGIFILQLVVFGIQAQKLHQTVKAAGEQAGDMKESIRQATRAATAMEKSADAATRASEAVAKSVAYIGHQVRAYLSVRVNGGRYQERSRNVRFEVKPLLINTGLTPAFKIRYTANAGVFPFPLLDDFEFPPLNPPRATFGILGSQQNFVMNAMMQDFVPDGEVDTVKLGIGKRLYIWGTVYYEDVSGIERHTEFAHNIYWIFPPDGGVLWEGIYSDRHIDAS